MQARVAVALLGVWFVTATVQAQSPPTGSQPPAWASSATAKAGSQRPPQSAWTPQTVLSQDAWVLSASVVDDTKSGKGNGNGDEEKNGKKEEKPPEHIKDNSFLVEEAYNQEPGVVQHIFNFVPTWDRTDGVSNRSFLFAYTMELPLCSQTHQFSFTMPVQLLQEQRPAPDQGGVGDIFLNYRLQFMVEDECPGWPAVAPRFSLLLPTGDKDRGLGTGELGYQFLLPISKQIEPFAFHFNAGCTYVPGASVNLGGAESPAHNLRSYNLGGSAIWLVNYEFNLMLELVAYWNEGLDNLGNRERSKIVILDPGFRWAAFTGDEVQWVLGVGLPIGLSRDAPDIGVFVYMSVEHDFKKKADNKSE